MGGYFYCPSINDIKLYGKPKHLSALKGMEGVINMKKYLDNKIKMNLQFFAEPPAGDELPPDDKNDLGEETPPDDKPALKYSDDDVNKIVKQKLARAEKEKAEAVEEAAKLAKMNADEKEKYDREKLENELAEYKKKDAFNSLSKEASKMLSEHNIPVDDEVFEVVVKDTADATKERVEWFSGLVNKLVTEGVKQVLAGKSPKVNTSPGQTLTKQQINEIKDPFERKQKIAENPHLFQK